MKKPGIAIITYKRPNYLAKTLGAIQKFTSPGTYELLVASDDMDDAETNAVCQKFDAPIVSGKNRGVVWNKNRALFFYMSRTDCDPIIILEDDTYPTDPDWLSRWKDAAFLWQHVNFTHPGMLKEGNLPLSGDGTASHPHIHTLLTGQCTAVTRSAMRVGGYLDTRFKGYGHGHVEWTKRHAAHLYPGLVEGFSSSRMLFVSIVGGLVAENAPTFRNEDDVKRNGQLLQIMSKEPLRYVAPWQSEQDKEILISELNNIKKPTIHTLPRPPIASLKQIRCTVDRLTICGARVKCFGWAKLVTGDPVDKFVIRYNGQAVTDVTFRRLIRKDVARAVPGAALDCGFDLEFTLPNSGALAGNFQLIATFASPEAPEELIYQRQLKADNLPPNSTISVLDIEKWKGRNLYFGNIYPHEKQFTEGNFLGLSLVPKFEKDILHNAYDLFPIPDGSVDKIQAQDVFEHLEYVRIPQILDEVYRVLAPGGVFRLSVPDYRSPILKARSVYDENGNVIADLMMGGSVRYDASTKARRVDLLANGNAHLWFPTYEKVQELISRSKISSCKIIFYHCIKGDGTSICEPFPDLEMPVRRAPPFDMRAEGQPISIIVDFVKSDHGLPEAQTKIPHRTEPQPMTGKKFAEDPKLTDNA